MTPLLRHADLYHTGIVVDDVDAAKAEYSDLMGVTWGPEGEVDVSVWLPDGMRMMSFKYAYTAEGPHRLELVRPTAGTLWTVTGPGHAHHIGYWCDDVPAMSAAMSARGMPLAPKVGVESADEDASIVLHRTASGLYVELVSSAARIMMFGENG